MPQKKGRRNNKKKHKLRASNQKSNESTLGSTKVVQVAPTSAMVLATTVSTHNEETALTPEEVFKMDGIQKIVDNGGNGKYDIRRHKDGIQDLADNGGKISATKFLKFLPGLVEEAKELWGHHVDIAYVLVVSLLHSRGELGSICDPFAASARHLIDLIWFEKKAPEPGSQAYALKAKFGVRLQLQLEDLRAFNAPCVGNKLKQAFDTTYATIFCKNLSCNKAEASFSEDSLFVGMNADGWEKVNQHVRHRVNKEQKAAMEKIYLLTKECLHVLHFLAIKHHKVRTKCWQCKVEQEKTIMTCSDCGIAQYCGKKCQKQAWNRGHKETCQRRSLHAKFLARSVDSLCEIYRKGEVHGIHPRPFAHPSPVDIICTAKDMFSKGLSRVPELGEPKLEHFFHNIAAVHRGEWWICTQPSSAEEVGVAVEELGRTVLVTQKLHNAALLCYDLEGVAKTLIMDSVRKEGIQLSIEQIEQIPLDSIIAAAIAFFVPRGYCVMQLANGLEVRLPPSFLLGEQLAEEPYQMTEGEIAKCRKKSRATENRWLRAVETRELLCIQNSE